jgi:hypothetical protein
MFSANLITEDTIHAQPEMEIGCSIVMPEHKTIRSDSHGRSQRSRTSADFSRVGMPDRLRPSEPKRIIRLAQRTIVWKDA